MFQKYRLREKIYDFIVIFQHWLFRYFGYFAQNLEDRDQSSAIYIVLSAASFVEIRVGNKQVKKIET